MHLKKLLGLSLLCRQTTIYIPKRTYLGSYCNFYKLKYLQTITLILKRKSYGNASIKFGENLKGGNSIDRKFGFFSVVKGKCPINYNIERV